jgi:hypothetical protein
MNSCFQIISHGEYPNEPLSNFTVPKNIRLIQYSKPGQAITEDLVVQVIKNNCDYDKEIQTMYYLCDDMKIYENRPYKTTIEPNNQTIDILLIFTAEPVGNVNLGVFNNKKNINMNYNNLNIDEEEVVLDTGKTKIKERTLSSVLKDLSELLIKDEDGIVDVYQLSCRSGDYTKGLHDVKMDVVDQHNDNELNSMINELSRDMELTLSVGRNNLPEYFTYNQNGRKILYRNYNLQRVEEIQKRILLDTISKKRNRINDRVYETTQSIRKINPEDEGPPNKRQRFGGIRKSKRKIQKSRKNKNKKSQKNRKSKKNRKYKK